MELKELKEMEVQGNWMFDLVEENWEVMVVWKNLMEKLKKEMVIKHHLVLEGLQQGKHLEKGLKPSLHTNLPSTTQCTSSKCKTLPSPLLSSILSKFTNTQISNLFPQSNSSQNSRSSIKL